MADSSVDNAALDLRVSRVLQNMEVALLQLHTRILRCEECIFDTSSQKEASLQDLDFIAQSHTSLASFIGQIAADLPNDQIINLNRALGKVQLASIADVLASEAPTGDDLMKLAGDDPAREIDFF